MSVRLYVDKINQIFELVFKIGIEHTIKTTRESGILQSKYYTSNEIIDMLQKRHNAKIIYCNLK